MLQWPGYICQGSWEQLGFLAVRSEWGSFTSHIFPLQRVGVRGCLAQPSAQYIWQRPLTSFPKGLHAINSCRTDPKNHFCQQSVLYQVQFLFPTFPKCESAQGMEGKSSKVKGPMGAEGGGGTMYTMIRLKGFSCRGRRETG